MLFLVSAAQVGQTILNLLIFLLCLSFVVCIHEAGHLTVAKICKVYCFEYSIGFGPLLFQHKFRHYPKGMSKEEKKFYKTHHQLPKYLYTVDENGKKKKAMNPLYDGKVEGETAFSLRLLPVGGYVSMAGEEEASEEAYGIDVPKKRTLSGVNHAKQIAIMLAGIAMNFLLAYLLFLFSYMAPQTTNDLSTNAVVVSEEIDNNTTPAYTLGLRSGDKIIGLYQHYTVVYAPSGATPKTVEFDFPAEEDRKTLTSYLTLKEGKSLSSYTYDDVEPTSIAYASQDIFYSFNHNLFTRSDAYKDYVIGANSTRTIYVKYISARDNKVVTAVSEPIGTKIDSNDTYRFHYFGIGASQKTVHYSPSQVFSLSNHAFSELFVGLYTALGSLFTPQGWQNVGGIISVYRMSAQGVSSGSLSYFLFLWGYISLDLGCFNLLPFPGLDGWQTLLALFETISRKKVPSKFKNVANYVGLIIMFVLAGLLVVKDLIFRG